MACREVNFVLCTDEEELSSRNLPVSTISSGCCLLHPPSPVQLAVAALQTQVLLSVLKEGPISPLRSSSTLGAAIRWWICSHDLILMPLIEHSMGAEVCEG